MLDSSLKFEEVKENNSRPSLDSVLFNTSWVTLRRIHLATCVFHLFGVALASVFLGLDEDWSIPVVTSLADWRLHNQTIDGCDEGNCFVTPAYRKRAGRWSLQGLVIAFHFLSFAWQALVLLDGCSLGVRSLYLKELERKRNAFRWCEYALSAPLMTVVIAIVFGVLDTYLLIALAVCTSVLQAFGYLQELFSGFKGLEKNLREVPFWVGVCFFVGYWSIVASAFVDSVGKSSAKAPFLMVLVIYLTFFFMTGLFSSFAGVLFYDMRVGGGVRYLNVEGRYCVLSLVSKWVLGALLAWFVSIRETEIELGFVLDPPCDRSLAAFNSSAA